VDRDVDDRLLGTRRVVVDLVGELRELAADVRDHHVAHREADVRVGRVDVVVDLCFTGLRRGSGG